MLINLNQGYFAYELDLTKSDIELDALGDFMEYVYDFEYNLRGTDPEEDMSFHIVTAAFADLIECSGLKNLATGQFRVGRY